VSPSNLPTHICTRSKSLTFFFINFCTQKAGASQNCGVVLLAYVLISGSKIKYVSSKNIKSVMVKTSITDAKNVKMSQLSPIVVLAANRIKNKTSATRNFLRKLKYSVPAIFSIKIKNGYRIEQRNLKKVQLSLSLCVPLLN